MYASNVLLRKCRSLCIRICKIAIHFLLKYEYVHMYANLKKIVSISFPYIRICSSKSSDFRHQDYIIDFTIQAKQ